MRDLQNIGRSEIIDQKIEYSLYNKGGNEVCNFGDNYTILWFDSKMINYVNLVKELPKKRIC